LRYIILNLDVIVVEEPSYAGMPHWIDSLSLILGNRSKDDKNPQPQYSHIYPSASINSISIKPLISLKLQKYVFTSSHHKKPDKKLER
jgi:hypothetical protein